MLSIILENFDTFLKNSILSIPLIIFIIALSLKNKLLFWIFLGILLTHLFNKLLKIVIAKYSSFPKNIIYRPYDARGCDGTNNLIEDDLGFPSGHSQFIWFLVVVLAFTSSNRNYFFYLVLIILAITISISRLGWKITNPFQFKRPCHTPLQVIIGAIIGIITGYYYSLFILSKKKFLVL